MPLSFRSAARDPHSPLADALFHAAACAVDAISSKSSSRDQPAAAELHVVALRSGVELACARGLLLGGRSEGLLARLDRALAEAAG